MPYQLGDEAILGAEYQRLYELNKESTNNQTNDWNGYPSQKYVYCDVLYDELVSSRNSFGTFNIDRPSAKHGRRPTSRSSCRIK